MISNSTDKDSNRTSSSSTTSVIVHDNYKTKSSVFSCCGCFRTQKNTPQLSRTKEDSKGDGEKGFFKRIQVFKGLRINRIVLRETS